MENRNKFTCQNCNHTFPMSELEINHLYTIPGEDTCRMCMAHALYEDNLDDYKVLHEAQELINTIWFERDKQNIQFGIYNGDFDRQVQKVLNNAGIEL